MKRNLDRRVETIVPVRDPAVQQPSSTRSSTSTTRTTARPGTAQPDGTYVRRAPAEGEPRRGPQEVFIRMAEAQAADPSDLA